MLRTLFATPVCKLCHGIIPRERLLYSRGFFKKICEVSQLATTFNPAAQYSTDKGTRTKLFISKKGEAEGSVLSTEENSDEYEILGLTEDGITIPTLETVDMTVAGVKFDELPIVNIFSTQNNTILKLTDHTGLKSMAQASCGSEGFKNVKKSTSIAAQAAGTALGNKTMRMGVNYVRVIVRGIGNGRLPSIKGLQMSGIKIVSITDNTIVPSNGPRPRKARRV